MAVEVPSPPLTEPDRAQALLDVRGLTVAFATERGTATVVDDFDLELRAGEIVGLVGESGSGKTVTGLAIMGLLPQNGRVVSGTISLAGQELQSLPNRAMRHIRGQEIGMIFQEPRRSLDPCFTVGDQVAEAIRAHRDVSRKEAKQQAIEMLDRVQIPQAASRAANYPHQFSGGQCQRIMLAIALVCQPRVLIADEPTTALDVTVQEEVLRLLDELRREMDLAILLVTHDLGVVAETCDRVEVMYAGQLVEHASVFDVFERPMHPYAAGLLGSVIQVGGTTRLRSIPGTVPPPTAWPEGCRFRPRCTHAEDRCGEAVPPLESFEDGARRVRCIRAAELDLGGAST